MADLAKLKRRKAAIEKRHAALEAELQAELARPLPDAIRVSNLKRDKLKEKDDLERVDLQIAQLEPDKESEAA